MNIGTNGNHNSANGTNLVAATPAVANLSDAMGQLGLKFQTMNCSIRPVFTGATVSGPAYTVQCYAGATYAVEEAIELANPGDVLIVAGEGYTGAVLMGELMSARAAKRGIAGAVIDGAVRDTAKLREAGWPMFAAGITPRAGTFDKLGTQQAPVSCAGVTVNPGDFIAADDDGVVVVPREHYNDVLKLAHNIEQKEAFLAQAISRGESLKSAVEQYGRSGNGKS